MRKVDVTAHVPGKAWPADPDVPEGKEPEEWILEIDGELELVTLDEIEDRVEFPNSYQVFDIEIPINDILKSYCYDPTIHDDWIEAEPITGTAYGRPELQAIEKIEFDDPVPTETFDMLDVTFEHNND